MGSRDIEKVPGVMHTLNKKIEGAWEPLTRSDGGVLVRHLGEDGL